MNLTFRMGELFSGPGGMALGARRAAHGINRSRLISGHVTLTHVWANDYDADTCETYLKNVLSPQTRGKARVVTEVTPGMAAGVIVRQDVRDLKIKQLGEIDGLAFGFPCNDYSSAGERKGLEGSFGPLYLYGVTVLAEKQPKWFVAENVSGLRGANEGRAFEEILEALQSPCDGLRYRIVPHLYSFDEYGVPQRRQRIVIVGIREDLDIDYRVPSPTLYRHINVSSAKALEAIPSNAPNHEHARLASQVVERLGYILPGQNAFNADIPESLQLKVRGLKNSQVYRRLDPDKPSYTVTGAGGGGTHVYHWEEPRALTNRERARLQSFPDKFEFMGLKDSVRKQIGMAVPVQGAQAIFTALFKSFLDVPYEHVDSNMSHYIYRKK